MPSFPLLVLFGVLLLLSTTNGVCMHCFGEASSLGCDGTTCPWQSGVASNVSTVAGILAGSATTVLSIAMLLPARLRIVFSRPILQSITSLLSKPVQGKEFDPDGKTFAQICNAIRSNSITKDEATMFYNLEMADLDLSEDASVLKMKMLSNHVAMINKMPSASSESSSRGVYLFILAKLSAMVCAGKDLAISLDACYDVEDESSSSSSSSSSSAKSAKLVRPKSMGNMMMLLNDFILSCSAIGLASPIVLCPFLADVVYSPVSDGTLDWPVAFELLILYLSQIEDNPDTWNFSNVFAKSGAIDVRRREATVVARARYPASFFRVHGGIPGNDTQRTQGGQLDLKNVTTWNLNATQACAAWNLGTQHRREHVDSTGRCKYLHNACDQYVTDKGKNGQCLANHKRGACKYDDAKKCSKPVSA